MPLDRKTADQLVQSTPWRKYLEDELLPSYDKVSETLDGATEDHRHLQGMKRSLRRMIERPYEICDRDSPLKVDRRVVDREFPKAEPDKPEPEPEVTPIRAPDRTSHPV